MLELFFISIHFHLTISFQWTNFLFRLFVCQLPFVPYFSCPLCLSSPVCPTLHSMHEFFPIFGGHKRCLTIACWRKSTPFRFIHENEKQKNIEVCRSCHFDGAPLHTHTSGVFQILLINNNEATYIFPCGTNKILWPNMKTHAPHHTHNTQYNSLSFEKPYSMEYALTRTQNNTSPHLLLFSLLHFPFAAISLAFTQDASALSQ